MSKAKHKRWRRRAAHKRTAIESRIKPVKPYIVACMKCPFTGELLTAIIDDPMFVMNGGANG